MISQKQLIENKWYQNGCWESNWAATLFPIVISCFQDSHLEGRKAVGFTRVVKTLLLALDCSEVRSWRARYR